MNNNKPIFLAAALVVLATLLTFLRALWCGFVNVDDPLYVLENPLIRQLDWGILQAAFTRAHVGWWMPLTWLSFAVDYHFWGLKPFGYHLTNILIHGANAGLVVLITDGLCRNKFTGGFETDRSNTLYFALLLSSGLLFGIHPLRVESVAWVSERKDVLNGLFSLGSILCYLNYVRKKMAVEKTHLTGRLYLCSLALFVLSLMAKSVSVVLPVMLLLLDWCPLGRMGRGSIREVVQEKVPFFAASLLMTAITFLFAGQSGYLVTYEAFPLSQRLSVSGNAVWEYLRMFLFPAGLSPLYVIPDPIPAAYVVKSVLVAVVIVCIGCSRRMPWLQTCLACFLLPLLPVLAFFQNGDQSYADRFTYLPSVALTITSAGVAAAFAGSLKARPFRWLTLLGGVSLLGALVLLTVRMIPVWQSTESYWTRVIAEDPIAINYKERGRYYHGSGRFEAAAADFTAALGKVTATLKPYEYNLYAFRGESLRCAGHLEDAVRDFTTAIAGLPHPAYFYHRGLALRALGRESEAAEDLQRSGPDPGPIIWFDKGP